MRYRPTVSLTLDPDIVQEAKDKLPVKKIRTFSALVESLLLEFLHKK